MKGRRVIETPDDLARLLAYLGDFPQPFTITVSQGKGRTLSQNALVHKWFSEIAVHFNDRDMLDVKADCNMAYGIPILTRDDEAYRRFLARLNLDDRGLRYANRTGLLPVTSYMDTKQLKEYMDMMERDYREQGVRLTDPEILKYENTTP